MRKACSLHSPFHSNPKSRSSILGIRSAPQDTGARRRGGRAPRRGGSSARCGPPARAGPAPAPAAPCRRPSSAAASAPAPPPPLPRPPPPPPRRPHPAACSWPRAPHGAGRRRPRPGTGTGTAAAAAAMELMCLSRQASGWTKGRLGSSAALDCAVVGNGELRWQRWVGERKGIGAEPCRLDELQKIYSRKKDELQKIFSKKRGSAVGNVFSGR